MVLAGSVVVVGTSRADLYDDYINSRSKHPFVVFLARGGFPGHAFVGTGVDLEAGLRVYERFYGYYPITGDKVAAIKLALGKTSGAIEYKWKDTSWDVNYLVPIDDAKKAAILAVLDRWKSDDPKYTLVASGGKNCSSLAGEMAEAAGLKTVGGAGTMLPVEYVRKLKAANGG